MNWGGKRKGAGRKPKGEKAGVRHEPRARITKHEPALVTLRVCPGLPTLRDDGVFALVKDVRAKSARADFRVVHFSLQSNHLHLVVEAHDNAALTRGMRSFTVRLAQGLKREFRRTGKVFSGRYHLHVLRTPKEVRNGLVYVLNNARKHRSWAVKRPDVYSTGDEFTGWREPRASWAPDRSAQSSSAQARAKAQPRPRRRPGMNSIEWFELACGFRQPARELAPVLARLDACSWLLRVGWLRHGKIGVMEAPKLGVGAASRSKRRA